MSPVHTKFAALLALSLASPLAAAAPEVSEARLKADVERLVSFGTRHTMSVQDDPKRGIGAARRWAEAEFRKTSKACGNCLEIALPERMVTAERIPVPTRLVNVIAIQRGTERPNEVVIIQAHIDSRASDVMNATIDAPGANDDASGTALVLEAARVLSQRKFPTTVVYAALSGEEQGLLGGTLDMAWLGASAYAKTYLTDPEAVEAVLGDDAGALLHGTVVEHDARWHLMRVEFDGGSLWLRDSGLTCGQRVRLRVLARDVSLATEVPHHTSIQNLLPATVDAIASDAHPSQALVRVACGGALLLSRITARAVDTLSLKPGQAVWAQVKSVALVE